MNNRDSAFLKERKSTKLHSSYIRNYKKIDDQDFVDIVDKVFGHHIAVYDIQSFNLADSAFLLSRENVSFSFYKNHYIPVEIKCDISGVSISVEDFIDRVVFFASEKRRNNIFFLIGDVGSGKTAFINNIITNEGKSWVDESNVCFLRIDVDITGNNRRLSVDELLDAIIYKAIRIIENNDDLQLGIKTKEYFKALKHFFNKPYLDKQKAFSDFVVSFYEENNKKLFLIIDNLDYLYHIHDRVMFDNDEDTYEVDAVKIVCDLVSIFFHSVLGKINANILFVLREDSYEILKESKKIFPSVSFFDDNKNVFSVVYPNWGEVVQQRGMLLKDIVSKIEKNGKKTRYKNIIDPIMSDLNYAPSGQKPLVEHLEKITNYGLRDMMHYFSQYSWLEGSENVGIERFIHQYPVGLLAFMLKGRRRFTQLYSEFPNIYLINVKEEKNQGNFIKSFEHKHTYWLKRLILHYIKQKELEKETVLLPKILGVFMGDGHNGYADILIRKCLGSLAQANLSNMIFAKKCKSVSGDVLVIDDIRLTHRGSHCLDNIFDRFFYLQLIVDDYMLPVPKNVSEYFDFGDLDYGYIVEQSAQYSVLAKNMVMRKIKEVFMFLEILEASYLMEQMAYSGAFGRLQDEGVLLPDIYSIKKGIEDEIGKLISVQGLRVDLAALKKSISEKKSSIEDIMIKVYE